MIRPATPADVDTLVGLIHDLAEYERSPGSVAIDRTALHNALFADAPTVFAHVSELDGTVAGMAIWFLNFSTWTGRNGIYLEDLYVRPEARGHGLGRALVTELASIAVRAGYSRVDWSVLRWNKSAIGFYRSLGATAMEEWTGYRLSGEALEMLGASRPRAR
ncbi:MAG: N-acetyltransferase family protein [Acidimicrobiales bacterium]